MNTKVHYLHPRPEPIGYFLRVGNSGHRQLETLHEAGCAFPDRVVFDAAWIDVQRDLLGTLREGGSEIALDSNVAELSALGRFDSAARKAGGGYSRVAIPTVADAVQTTCSRSQFSKTFTELLGTVSLDPSARCIELVGASTR